MKIDAKTFFNSIAIAGCLIFTAGVYYAIVKAGIPYQDPTPEMSFNYEVNYRVGEVLFTLGAAALALGAVGRAVMQFVRGKKRAEGEAV